jgi:ElaB/YqjD/DUF883 family membrane-anchored ribosome-binding protein
VDRIRQASDSAHRAIDKAAALAYRAAEKLGGKGDPRKNAVEDCHRYIRQNPVKTTAMAIAAGFLLSRLLLF